MLESLVSFVTVLLALSAASERLVELVKGFSAHLTGQKADTDVERKRQLTIQWMSLAASAVVVFLLQNYIVDALNLKELGWPEGVAFTILSSGGSSMWNSILTYLLSLKALKQQDVNAQQKADNADLARRLPMSMPAI